MPEYLAHLCHIVLYQGRVEIMIDPQSANESCGSYVITAMVDLGSFRLESGEIGLETLFRGHPGG